MINIFPTFLIMILIIMTLSFICIYLYINYKNNIPKIYVKKSTKGGESGRGVFANKNIKKGEIIEKTYFLMGSMKDLKVGIYRDYIYKLTDADAVGFPLGNGGLYNTSKNNNAVVRSYGDRLYVYAIKDIKKDDEIFVCYGCNHPDKNLHYNYEKSHKIKFD